MRNHDEARAARAMPPDVSLDSANASSWLERCVGASPGPLAKGKILSVSSETARDFNPWLMTIFF